MGKNDFIHIYHVIRDAAKWLPTMPSAQLEATLGKLHFYDLQPFWERLDALV